MSQLLGSLFFFLFFQLLVIPGSAQVNLQRWPLEQTRRVASTEDRLFFLYFTADWCAPCHWMEEQTLRDPALGQYIADHYLAVEVDIDQGPAALLRKQFVVEDIPSILVFSAAGQLIDRHKGTITAPELKAWLTALDQPVHHLKAVQANREATTALSSPTARIAFSRPALGTSQAIASPALSQNESSKLLLAGEPVMAAAAPESFVPRDGGPYAIILTDTSYTYEAAIDAVVELERKYQQRGELQWREDGRYELILGEFSRRQAASAFLIYLQRNDRQGEIWTPSR